MPVDDFIKSFIPFISLFFPFFLSFLAILRIHWARIQKYWLKKKKKHTSKISFNNASMTDWTVYRNHCKKNIKFDDSKKKTKRTQLKITLNPFSETIIRIENEILFMYKIHTTQYKQQSNKIYSQSNFPSSNEQWKFTTNNKKKKKRNSQSLTLSFTPFISMYFYTIRFKILWKLCVLYVCAHLAIKMLYKNCTYFIWQAFVWIYLFICLEP